jgi:hypothetical protein
VNRIDRIDLMFGILDKTLVTVFVLLLGSALGVVSFMAGANHAVQKHEDTYCPQHDHVRFQSVEQDSSSADIPKGCRNGEAWDE